MVVDQAAAGTDELFHALADATRRDIVMRTMRAPHSVSSLARSYPMSFAAVQKHVCVLERAGLVTKQRLGREQLVRADIGAVRRVHRALDAFESVWRQRLERIEGVLSEGGSAEPRMQHPDSSDRKGRTAR